MAPIGGSGSLMELINDYIDKNKVMIFSKSTCPFCTKAQQIFDSLGVEYKKIELDQIANGDNIHSTLKEMSGQRTVPNIFINKKHIGGYDDTAALHKSGKLLEMISSKESYDFDLIVIGGGSGGLAAAKEAASFDKKVAIFDFVKPTPLGTTWGLGGTCVNVGCIPKKLMHQAALLGEGGKDSKAYGWSAELNVLLLIEILKLIICICLIQDHIGSLNWGYRVQLREKKVTYYNAYAKFVGPHKIEATDKKGKVISLTAEHFLISTGLRPNYLECPGAEEYCITSDDLFSLPYCPGKTLLVGASYISLECAGFLRAFGLDVTVMVRSILLRGFDRQMAELIGDNMEDHGIKFIKKGQVKKVEQLKAGEPGRLKVTYVTESEEKSEEFDTVVLAIGRQALTKDLNLDSVGVKVNPKNNKIICNESEMSNVPYIHAVGDVSDGKPELTPVAIQAGILLARRLFTTDKTLCDYNFIATTVFTPLEYGCIGISEDTALEKYGDDIEVYHSNFIPLEYTVPQRSAKECYVKLICQKSKNDKVIGFHYAGPNAGEVTQGYAVALRLGATKKDFDATVGIHPTCSEVFTTLATSKSSGMSVEAGGC
ncbi:thioredoxin reductase 1, cytoplasmic [Octopus vulgaris]|nr:thioredoxin reductase 1, cytoplasmic [Octopus vulgaris]